MIERFGCADWCLADVVTTMVALMVMQHAVERYWSVQTTTSSWQDLLFVLFISYPMITLMLVVLTNNEMAIRRFMYYRLMSLQVSTVLLTFAVCWQGFASGLWAQQASCYSALSG